MTTKQQKRIPPDIAKAIEKNRAALAGFQQMPPSHQREYFEYILEAKKPETRAKRIRQAMKLMAAYWETKKRKTKRERTSARR